jgi:hypothetical protein
VSSGRPVEVTESGLGVDEITGDVVIPNDHTVPREYGVRSAVLVVEESTLDGATPAAAQGDPAIADDLKLWARQAAGGQGGHRALRQLEEHLRSYELDASAKPTGGHGVYQVRQLHLSRRGTAEQYASAFALLARALGFHTRVVVGFRPRHVARDEYAVTGKDVHAWAEVRFDGIGWVPYDPTPSRIWTGTPEGTEAQDRATPAPAASAAPAATSGPSAQGPSAAPGHGDPAWPALALVLAASAVVYVGAVGTAKAALRWRRRRVPSPRWRTLYAWRDTLDRLREAGLRVAPSDTPREIAVKAVGRLGETVGEPTMLLAIMHDAAAYASVPDVSGEQAWGLADEVRQRLRATLPRVRRLAAVLSLGPLLRLVGRPRRRPLVRGVPFG